MSRGPLAWDQFVENSVKSTPGTFTGQAAIFGRDFKLWGSYPTSFNPNANQVENSWIKGSTDGLCPDKIKYMRLSGFNGPVDGKEITWNTYKKGQNAMVVYGGKKCCVVFEALSNGENVEPPAVVEAAQSMFLKTNQE